MNNQDKEIIPTYEDLERALTSAREEIEQLKKQAQFFRVNTAEELRDQISIVQGTNREYVELNTKLREENERLKKERDEDLIELLDYLLVENFGYYENQDGNTWFVEKSSGRKLTSEELLAECKKGKETNS